MKKDTGILLVACPDQKGLVAAIADFVFKNGGNILSSDQYQDEERHLFLMRCEFLLNDFTAPTDKKGFAARFEQVAVRFNMRWRFEMSAERPKVAIFVSKYDHCLVDLLQRHENGELRCDIAAIISNHPDTKRHADFYGVPFHHVPVTAESKPAAEKQQRAIVEACGADLLVLARYMQVLSERFVDEFVQKIINVHHSFLPAFSGAKPYQRAFERGVKLVGATAHYVTKDLDEGPIIEQAVARVTHRDQLEDLIEKGRDVEKAVLSRAVRWHIEHRVLMYGDKTVVFN